MISEVNNIIRYLVIFLLIISIASSSSVCDSIEFSYNECTKSLQKLLNDYHYTKEYTKDVFDCVDSSVACFEFLEDHNYNCSFGTVLSKDRKSGHVTVLVYIHNKYFVVETTSNYGFTLGEIKDFDTYQIKGLKISNILKNVDQVYDLDTRSRPVINYDIIVSKK